MLLSNGLCAPGIRHAFSGELRTPEEIQNFATSAGFEACPRVRLTQVHGDGVIVVGDNFDFNSRPPGDAIVTTRANVALTVAHADCVPILLADAEAGVIAAVHAGWRGTRARVLLRALEVMVQLGASGARLRAAIGPAVAVDCYQVGAEVRADLLCVLPGAEALFDHDRLNLHLATHAELDRFGVLANHIHTIAICTHCDLALASHRRQGKDRGTNLAVIARRA